MSSFYRHVFYHSFRGIVCIFFLHRSDGIFSPSFVFFPVYRIALLIINELLIFRICFLLFILSRFLYSSFWLSLTTFTHVTFQTFCHTLFKNSRVVLSARWTELEAPWVWKTTKQMIDSQVSVTDWLRKKTSSRSGTRDFRQLSKRRLRFQPLNKIPIWDLETILAA